VWQGLRLRGQALAVRRRRILSYLREERSPFFSSSPRSERVKVNALGTLAPCAELAGAVGKEPKQTALTLKLELVGFGLGLRPNTEECECGDGSSVAERDGSRSLISAVDANVIPQQRMS
jgi:hypothetical protein